MTARDAALLYGAAGLVAVAGVLAIVYATTLRCTIWILRADNKRLVAKKTELVRQLSEQAKPRVRKTVAENLDEPWRDLFNTPAPDHRRSVFGPIAAGLTTLHDAEVHQFPRQRGTDGGDAA